MVGLVVELMCKGGNYVGPQVKKGILEVSL